MHIWKHALNFVLSCYVILCSLFQMHSAIAFLDFLLDKNPSQFQRDFALFCELRGNSDLCIEDLFINRSPSPPLEEFSPTSPTPSESQASMEIEPEPHGFNELNELYDPPSHRGQSESRQFSAGKQQPSTSDGHRSSSKPGPKCAKRVHKHSRQEPLLNDWKYDVIKQLRKKQKKEEGKVNLAFAMITSIIGN